MNLKEQDVRIPEAYQIQQAQAMTDTQTGDLNNVHVPEAAQAMSGTQTGDLNSGAAVVDNEGVTLEEEEQQETQKRFHV